MRKAETFGTSLRNFRNIAGLTQGELAEECTKSHLIAPSQKDISLYESGKKMPRLDKFASLVDALNLTYSEVTLLVRLSEHRRVRNAKETVTGSE